MAVDSLPKTYPFSWVSVEDDELLTVKRTTKYKWIKSVPGNVWMKSGYAKNAERIFNFEVRPDDIWILTYPKCGTTWAQVNFYFMSDE